jgi:hypothetical protein
VRILLAEWVSPFGHPRIKVCCRLPEAFRRLPRPSSPLTAKASTVCACSLDPITPKRLSVLEAKQTSIISLTCLNDTFRSFAPVHGLYSVALGRAPNACYVPSCQRTKPGLQRPASKPLGSSEIRSTQVFCLFQRAFQRCLRQLVEPVGFEPTTPCLQSRCSTN